MNGVVTTQMVFPTAMEKSASFEETEAELSCFMLSVHIYFVGFKYTVKE